MTLVSEKLTASIIRTISKVEVDTATGWKKQSPYQTITTLMMEAVRSSKTMFNIYQTTQCNIPEEKPSSCSSL
jgi:hypothetical protein